MAFKILIGLAVLFFIIYSLPLAHLPLFNSPDENANFFFSKLFAERDDLRVLEEANIIGEDQIHPRSITSRDAYLVPGSFIGLPLIFAAIAKFFSLISISAYQLIPYLTPFFAILGVLAFFGIIRRIFDDQVALISSLLLFIHPAFWYFSSRTMFPNILFVSLLISGVYFLIRAYADQCRYNGFMLINILLSGVCIGLALLVRTSEIIWVGPLLIAIWIILLRRELTVTKSLSEAREGAGGAEWAGVSLAPPNGGASETSEAEIGAAAASLGQTTASFRAASSSLLVFLVPIALSAILLFSWNTILYGSPFAFGYVPPQPPTHNSQLITSLIFPFGFHPRLALYNFFNYFLGIFWWWTIPLAYGIWLIAYRLIKGRMPRKQKLYLFSCFFIFLFLVLVYGSGQFIDRLDVQTISIGSSYVRYWLPAYILSLPFIAIAFQRVADLCRSKRRFMLKTICYMLFAISFVAWNSYFVLAATDESLLSVGKTLQSYEVKLERVLNLTEQDSIIIAGRYDKIIFPERKVVFDLFDPGFFKVLPALLLRYPLYYYSRLSSHGLQDAQAKLKSISLKLSPVAGVDEGEELMKIIAL